MFSAPTRLRLHRALRSLMSVTIVVSLATFLSSPAAATVFGNVRGVVHDPQHQPINGARTTLQASDSAYKLTADTSADGEFHFDAVPLGKYSVTVEAPGFVPQSQILVVVSGSAPVLHYQLAIAAAQEKVTVTASVEEVNPDSPRRDILVSQQQIA